jgi:hypothetical protein
MLLEKPTVSERQPAVALPKSRYEFETNLLSLGARAPSPAKPA